MMLGDHIPIREKLILAGLYLAKFDSVGLQTMGFNGFTEAFNVLGYAFAAKPATIKNYRDEFDPYFPNVRQGWHKRPLREHCRQVMDKYQSLTLSEFTALVQSFAGIDPNILSDDPSDDESVQFAKRQMTGLAAENFFELNFSTLKQFSGWSLESTRLLGCGYDYRLRNNEMEEFLAVEVKGLHGHSGNLTLTSKEYSAADKLSERYYLFVVKNFAEAPFCTIHRNPLKSGLQFLRQERFTITVSWFAQV